MRSLRASESTRLLSDSFEASESGFSTASAPSIVPQRWRRRFPVIQSAVNLTRSKPLRVSLFAIVAFAFGLVVLAHTQNLELTANLPASAFGAAGDLPGDAPVPKFRADASNCSELYFEQKVDHFAWLADGKANSSKAATYQQRYLINDQFWDPSNKKAPVFFYTGNEGDVTLYANHTGLMWENAEQFSALIVFAEHRYYGKSLPFGDKYMDHLAYLNHEQALADFTELIFFLQREHDAADHPVIAFGGSYGGMLSAWFRMKYPSIVHGAIAASAPIFGFPSFPEWKGDNYWKVVTRDASPETGSAKNCVPNAKKAWPKIFELAKTEAGRAKLSSIFRLCSPLTQESEGESVAMLVLFGFDNLAMGNFPYPSSYLTGGAADLPAWPVREACSHLAEDFEDGVDDDKLLAALRDAGNVFNNATKNLACLKLPSQQDFDGIWDFQWCTQMLPQETYFNSNGESDMFWPRSIEMQQITEHCQQTWQTTPDPDWIRVSYGDASLRFASNIVFSNGMLDPWSSGGVQHVPAGSKVSIVSIEEGAHHLDLFFSHPDDPESVKKARETEVKHIRQWIRESIFAYRSPPPSLFPSSPRAVDLQFRADVEHVLALFVVVEKHTAHTKFLQWNLDALLRCGLLLQHSSLASRSDGRFLAKAHALLLGAVNNTLNASTQDASFEFSRIKLSDKVTYDSVTIEVPTTAKRYHYDAENTQAFAPNKTSLYQLTLGDNCNREACMSLGAEKGEAGNAVVTRPRVQVTGICTSDDGTEDLLVFCDDLDLASNGNNEECERKANSSVLVVSIGSRIEGDHWNFWELGRNDRLRFFDARMVYSITVARLSWETENLAQAFGAECDSDAGCEGLRFKMNPDLRTSDYLVVGENSLPLRDLGHVDVLALKRVEWTQLVSVTPGKGSDVWVNGEKIESNYDLLLPRRFSTISANGASIRTSPLEDCVRFVDDYINAVEKNHLYMERSLQTSYTAAFYFLFQNAVRQKSLNTTTESSSSAASPQLAFAGNLQLMNVQISIPTTNAVISLVGCFLLFLVGVGVVFLAKRSEHQLQQRADAEIVAEAAMNSSEYPPWLLKMELEQVVGSEGNPPFSLQDLRVQSVILHHNEDKTHAFHVGSEM